MSKLPSQTAEVPESSETKLASQNGAVSESALKEIENRVRENLRAEYARESESVKEVLENVKGELEELREKDRLNTEDKARMAALERKEDALEAELLEFNTKPEFRAANEKIRRAKEEAKSEAVTEAEHRVYVVLMEEMIEEKAEAEGIEAKNLRKELNEILSGGKYADKNAFQRAKLALRDRAKLKAFEKEKAEFKKKQAELQGSPEDGTHAAREDTLSESRAKEDTVGWAKKIGL